MDDADGRDERGSANRALWMLLGVFWNREERRFRALFRLVLAVVTFGVLSVAIGLGFQVLAIRSLVVGALTPAVPELSISAVLRVVSLLLTAVGAVLVVWLAGRFLDRRPFAAFGFRFDRGWWLDLGFGLALGAGLMAAVFLVELAAGWVTVAEVLGPAALSRTGIAVELLAALALFVAVGIYEELLFRGYLLTNAAEGSVGVPLVGPRAAIAVATLLTAGLFGAVHANNPNATLVSTANITFAGVFLAAGYLLTAELAIPIGLHITWNLFQGAVFGFPVSGTTIGASVVRVEQSGPAIVTGGPFGPEAGLVGLGAMVLGICLTIAWVRVRYDSVGLATALAEPTLRWRERETGTTDADSGDPTGKTEATGET
jgi:membrane protease YdiL (CAAX protease family)